MAQNIQGNYNLAKFAFNIYGTLNSSNSNDSVSPNSSLNSKTSKNYLNHQFHQKLVFNCERESTALSQLNFGIQINNYNNGNEISHHAVIGGKNYLRLLCLNEDQSRIIQDINLLDSKSIYRGPIKLNNINTIKTHSNTIACGLSSGAISLYKVSPSGQGKLYAKLSDHKRTINSLDFIDSDNQFVSGSQDGSIKLWDLRASINKPVLTLQANLHNDPIRACQYSPHSLVRNKTCILSVHDSGALCKFDLRSSVGSNMYSPDKKWNLHSGPVLSLHIHPEKEYVATGGRDQKICVLNYGESQSSSTRSAADSMINTYGSVLKVRWGCYPLHETLDEFNEPTGSAPNPLMNYDLACSYFDDPTITVFNLNRKYIPKQIMTSYLQKPMANFVWAQNNNQSRKIWTLSKANMFTAYDLDSTNDPDVRQPLEDLNSLCMTWNNDNNFIMVNQDKFDFEINDEFESDDLQSQDNFEFSTNENFDDKLGTSLTTSPIEKPQLVRSYTHNPMQQLIAKSPSPVLRTSTNGFDLSSSTPGYRPKLTRNPSQNTQESTLSFGSAPQPSRKSIRHQSHQYHNYGLSSPYAIPVEFPFPTNDDEIFRVLSTEYIVKIPDGFNVADVCLLNANTADQAGSHRTSQVWRLIALTLEELNEPIVEEEVKEEIIVEDNNDSDSHNDNKSIQSDLGNIVGSFNSNSTSTTNYGNKVLSDKNNSNSNLMEAINNSRKNSFSQSFRINKEAEEDNISEHSKSKPISINEGYNNENANLMNSAFLRSSPNSGGTFSSLASSPKSNGAISRKYSQTQLAIRRQSLNKIEETPTESTLTKKLRINESKAWGLKNLLKKSLDYAVLQGDIIFCSSISLLFYDITTNIISFDQCLDWLSIYIEILQRKQLFVNAINILNSAPLVVQQELSKSFSSDLIRLYCSNCMKLLVNETSKHSQKGEFGYWYCDECKSLQSTCVYCNEPCKGLVVNVNLKCGHRGHFGCLKTWFIDDENIECPGGCDLKII
ncbi:RTC1 [Candida jiufengensis]|uniref:RTC1 n=1 Tax=Candida jiufengensis TaxID=497108 RepID=UPI002223EEB1|nr:RTC1 [Candida jiufengensis]KAI5957365.1 RTC1 [Candida jiufengensis]